jgi:hypothetical protein
VTTADNAGAPPKVKLSDKARHHATRRALEAWPSETGGILLGWHDGETMVVSDALQVDDPEASPHGYMRNDGTAQHALDAFLSGSSDPRVGYIGEWHSHPSPQPPSHIDYTTLRELALDTDYQVALAVFSVDADRSVTAHLATATRTGSHVRLHVQATIKDPRPQGKANAD